MSSMRRSGILWIQEHICFLFACVDVVELCTFCGDTTISESPIDNYFGSEGLSALSNTYILFRWT